MAKDPYRYFRIEAQELLESLHRGLLALDKGEGDEEQVRALLRHAHTFKGAARVVKQFEIGDLAHRIEGLLSPHRDSDGKIGREVADAALTTLDQIRGLLVGLDEPPSVAGQEPSTRTAATDADPSTVRIHIAEMDALLEGLAAAGAATARAGRGMHPLDEAVGQARKLTQEMARPGGARPLQVVEALLVTLETARRQMLEGGEEVGVQISELRRAVSDLRLIGAETLMTELERTVRDTAATLGKNVAFRAQGANTRIDAHLLAGLRTALRHIVGNAVAHGIEDESSRLAAGKPATGNVEISMERLGHRVAIVCRDDGSGIDTDAVRRVAVERRLASPEGVRALDVDQLTNLLLHGGISTAAELTSVSGRGVGLDVVRNTIARLKGKVDIRSVPGEGTTVEVLVPVSLSALPALEVEEDGVVAFVPLDSVRQTLRLPRHEISRSAEGDRVVVDGTVIPFIPLRRALRRSAAAANENPFQTAVVLQSGGRGAALGVDRLHGIDSVIVRSLPEHLDVDPVVAGAAVENEGAPALVLAPGFVVEAAGQARPAPEVAPAAAKPPLLVIDDSLTTRMLEQSILESAGYEVEVAASAEEGLQKAKARRYAVFIVDVEMPGMNGFEFIARTRQDAELREVPAVLVSSRAAAQDKRRGKEVGARAYIVKSEFDQKDLLETVRRLVG